MTTTSLSWICRAARGDLSVFDSHAYRSDTLSTSVLGRDVVIVNRPNLARRVLVHRADTYPKHPFLNSVLAPLVGDGVFVSGGARWRQRRAIFEQWLDGSRLRQMFTPMRAATDNLIVRLQEQTGSTVDLEREMTGVTADAIYRTIFGGPITQDLADLLHLRFAAFRRAAHALFLTEMLRLPPTVRPLSRHRLHASGTAIRAATREYLDSAQSGSATEPGLIGLLRDTVDPATRQLLTEQQLLDEILVVLLAGHETSAAALAWSLHSAAHRPDVQEALRREISEVCGERPLAMASIGRLKQVRGFFREILRLFPPIPFYLRQAAEPDRLSTHAIEPGAMVVVCPWIIHRRPNLWAAATDLEWHRFSDPAQKRSVATAYLPFGLGPRACPGAGFALQEATLILAEVLRRFHLEPAAEASPTPIAHLTLHARGGLKVGIRRLGGR